MKNFNPKKLAYLLLRIALGLNIFLHGAIRLGAGYQKFVDWTVGVFKASPIPDFAVQAMAHCIPPIEFILGFLLLFGIFTYQTLTLGTLFMIGLMAGMCIVQSWEIVGIQLIYILIYTSLIFSIDNNNLSIDQLVFKKYRTDAKREAQQRGD